MDVKMARQYMTKEVTSTKIQSGKIVIENGLPKVEPMPELTVMGTISDVKATKLVYKKYGMGATIYNTETETKVYRMKVEDFIKVAELVTEDTLEEDEDDADDEEEDEIVEEEKPKAKRGSIKRVAKEEQTTLEV